MLNVLEVLNGSGHLTLTWDAGNAAEVAAIREEVARLKAAGYAFFTVEGAPADEVTAGHGELRCTRVDEPPGLGTTPPVTQPETSGVAPRRGRPRGSSRTVAVRPQAGG